MEPTPSEQPPAADRLHLVSYNLDGLDPFRRDERAEAAMMTLLMRPNPPMAIAFQEVVSRSFFAHLRPHLSAAGYHAVPAQPPDQDDFVCWFIRPPLVPVAAHRAPWPTSMGRHALVLDVGFQGTTWRLITGHLESLKSGKDNRVVQAAWIKAQLQDHDGPAVFIGDTNWRVSDGKPGLTDAFNKASRPEAHRFTWDMQRNPNRDASAGRKAIDDGRGKPRCRFDRCWLDSEHWEVTAFELWGTETNASGLCPSDHFAISMELKPIQRA